MAALALLVTLPGCGSDETQPVPEPPPTDPEPFSVMSFNVLCSFCGGDEYDTWDERLEYFADIFARYDPDLVGLQELSLAPEVDRMLERLPGRAAAFFRNPDSNFAYPDATVLYRTSRFEVRSHGYYWLSPTPEVVSSTGFADPQLPRLVTWLELRDKQSHRSLYFATTHVDNNAPSQELSAPLILERTEAWSARMPIVLVGDFNSQPSDPAYQILINGADGHPPLTNAFDLADSWSVEHNQATEPAYDLDQRIDHIFIAPQPADWSVPEWKVDLHVYGPNSRYPSDHFAIFARLLAPPL
jgi:endonuclease/exonuclease/phosphatase family metal-dependent hydrolase